MIAPHATNIQGVKIPPAYCRKDPYLEVLCSKCISPQWLTEKLGLGRYWRETRVQPAYRNA